LQHQNHRHHLQLRKPKRKKQLQWLLGDRREPQSDGLDPLLPLDRVHRRRLLGSKVDELPFDRPMQMMKMTMRQKTSPRKKKRKKTRRVTTMMMRKKKPPPLQPQRSLHGGEVDELLMTRSNPPMKTRVLLRKRLQ
jgi:hypothetical protein